MQNVHPIFQQALAGIAPPAVRLREEHGHAGQRTAQQSKA